MAKDDCIYLIEVDLSREVLVTVFDDRAHFRKRIVDDQKIFYENDPVFRQLFFEKDGSNCAKYHDYDSFEEHEMPLIMQTFEDAELEYWCHIYRSEAGGRYCGHTVWLHLCAHFQVVDIDLILENDPELEQFIILDDDGVEKEGSNIAEIIQSAVYDARAEYNKKEREKND